MFGDAMVAIIKDASRRGVEPSSIVWGTVKSTSPIIIQVENDPKLQLTEEFLILSPLCKEKKIDIPQWRTGVGGTEDPHDHNIPKHPDVLVWRGLKSGDRVIMLKTLEGNLFYVLQREGDL